MGRGRKKKSHTKKLVDLHAKRGAFLAAAIIYSAKTLPYHQNFVRSGELFASSTNELLFPLFSLLLWSLFSFFSSSTASTIPTDIAISHRQNVRVCDSSLNAHCDLGQNVRSRLFADCRGPLAGQPIKYLSDYLVKKKVLKRKFGLPARSLSRLLPRFCKLRDGVTGCWR